MMEDGERDHPVGGGFALPFGSRLNIGGKGDSLGWWMADARARGGWRIQS